MDKKQRYWLLILLFIFVSNSCVRAKEVLRLSQGNDTSILQVSSEDLRIVKIDSQFVDIRGEGETGTPYSKVALSPGAHQIVVRVYGAWEGSVYFLNVYIVKSREYILKYAVGDRVKRDDFPYVTNKWKADVWIEDAVTSLRVSEVAKNI